MSCVLLNLQTVVLQSAFYRLPVLSMIIIPCLLIALFSRLQKQPPPHLNSFILYILLSLCVEMISWRYSVQKRNNLIFYNTFIIVSFPYLMYLIRSFLITPRTRRLLTWVMVLYPLVALANMLFIQGTDKFNTYTFVPGCILVVIACICYFYERIKYPGQESLLRDPTFWISTGLLFYYACSPSLNGILNYISTMPFDSYKTPLLINMVLNIILYLLFSISFICNLISRRSS
jgi:hypothetical protein